jgi:hypothetical protein
MVLQSGQNLGMRVSTPVSSWLLLSMGCPRFVSSLAACARQAAAKPLGAAGWSGSQMLPIFTGVAIRTTRE